MDMRSGNLVVQIALALSAASALIYEVVVTDQLFFYFIESSYSLATVLSVFLFGLGVGSLSIYFLSSKIENPRKLFGFLQLFIAVYAFFVLTNLTNIIGKISTLGTFVTSFILLLVPTLFLGAIFPLTSLVFKRRTRDVTGLIYSFDLFGAIAGSLIAGFVLLPFYGAKVAIIVGGALNLVSSFLIFPRGNKKIAMFSIVLIFLLIFFLLLNLLMEIPKDWSLRVLLLMG